MRRGFPWSLLGIFLLVVVSVAFAAFPQEVQAAGVALRPPFDGVYRMTAAFDHQYPNYTRDGSITIYTGESAPDPNRCDPTATATYCYDGHNGYDWGLLNGTPILAAADGTVVRAQWWGGYGWQLVIDHRNGFYTMYGHLQGFNVGLGQNVRVGDLVAWSDNTGTSSGPHLHFTVYRGGYDSDNYATDPFGWRGSGADPLRDFGIRHTAECLWRGLPGDPISCFDHIVEDHYPNDGGGWSHWDWWDAVSGNNVWAHWTYTWATPTSWARWYPHGGGYNPISHHGFYRVYAFIPSTVGTRTRNAQYQVHYYPSGSVESVSVDQSAIGNNWRYLTTREMEPNADYCYVYLDDYTGEGQRTRRVAADAVKFSAVETYLPTIRSTDGWTTYLHIRNLSESQPANVSLSYYRSDGTRWGSIPYTIPAKGTQTVIPGGGFNGAAVVVSDQDVAVIVRREKSDEVAAYTGLSLANWGTGWGQPGVEVFIPTVFYDPYWGNTQWKTTLHVQNAGSGTAHFSITYFDRSGNLKGTSSASLNLNGWADYLPSQWGPGYEGAAYILSDQPLAVVVTQEDSRPETRRASQYNAFSSGANVVYIPGVMRAWYNWTSSFTVQNTGSVPTDITVKYYAEEGVDHTCTLTNLQPHASCIVVQDQSNPSGACGVIGSCAVPLPSPPGPGWGWEGAVVLTATQPIVAIVNQEQVAGSQHSHQSYSAFLGGGSTLYGPFAANCWTSGSYIYRSSSHVQNVGKEAATISTLNGYFYLGGGSPAPGGSSQGRGAGKVAMFYVPVEGVPNGSVVSVRVTRSAGIIAGIHNYARGLAVRPCADPAGELNDYGASYNLPQR